MATSKRESGIRLDLPDEWSVQDINELSGVDRLTRKRRAPDKDATDGGAANEREWFVAALRSHELTPVDEMEFASKGTGAATRRGPAQNAQIHVEVGNEEHALLLVERDGEYSWVFEQPGGEGSNQSNLRRSAGGAGNKEVTFDLQLAVPSGGGGQRRGVVSELVFGTVKAFVFKFVAQAVAKAAIRHFEKNLRTGFVIIDGHEPSQWKFTEGSAGFDIPGDRPARILLFLHGTFSNTIGSYGTFAATEHGRWFIDEAAKNYDVVVGYDHATLSVTPLENAIDLLQALNGRAWPHMPIIDVVCHSRGGLVFRSVTELAGPTHSEWQAVFDRVIFVAATNAGTPLADPDNWHRLVNIYTNVAVGATRVLAALGLGAAVAVFVEGLLKGVGSFVKFLASEVVSNAAVPGLASMEPGGDFVENINKIQQGQPDGAHTKYYAITSEFDAGAALGTGTGSEAPNGLPKRLLLSLASGLTGQLMQVPNDLVVSTQSMTAIDYSPHTYIKDQLHFEKNGVVYHTVYFLQPKVFDAMSRWLGFGAPGDSGELRRTIRFRDEVLAGAIVAADIPVKADTEVLVSFSDEIVHDVLDRVDDADPDYVVVRRNTGKETYHYAFRPVELQSLQQQSNAHLGDALGLHEYQASAVAEVGGAIPVPASDGPITARRVVLFDQSIPVGVIPETQFVQSFDFASGSPRESGGVEARAVMSQNRRRGFARAMRHFDPNPPNTDPPAVQEDKLTCHFRAEMPGQVQVGKTASVQVTVSREILSALTGSSSGIATGSVNPDRKVTVQILAKQNCRNEGGDRVTIDVPKPGQPAELLFDIVPTGPGDGVVQVFFLQGPLSLASIVLNTQFTQQAPGRQHRVDSTATVTGPEPFEGSYVKLRIEEIRRGSEVFFQFDLDSDQLDAADIRFESRPLTGNIPDYVVDRYKQIEDKWISTNNDLKIFLEELRAIGGEMWDELIPKELQRILWENKNRLGSVWIWATEPFIPWELIHFKDPDRPACRAKRCF